MTDRPEEREQSQRQRAARRQGLAYQGAFEAVIAILIATGLGYWIDTSFDTTPYGLLIGAAVGFGSFVLRLLRLGRLLQQVADEEATENDGSD